MIKLDFSDTRNNKRYKIFNSAKYEDKDEIFNNMERFWNEPDLEWVYQEKCKEFLENKFKFENKNLLTTSNLVDLGSGKGHAIIRFSYDWNFNKIIGVELNPEYYQICLYNIKKIKDNSSDIINTMIEVKNMNAVNFKFTPDINFLYLFNPFGAKTLERVILNLISSLKTHPREFYVIYRNAIHLDIFHKYKFIDILRLDDIACVILRLNQSIYSSR